MYTKYETLFFLAMSAVLPVCVWVCAIYEAVVIFQGDVRLSLLPESIMFVILIYRLTKAACIHREASLLLQWKRAGQRSHFLSWISWCDLDFAELQYASKWATKWKQDYMSIRTSGANICHHTPTAILAVFVRYMVLLTATSTRAGQLTENNQKPTLRTLHQINLADVG